MLQSLREKRRAWRERSRAYKIERALYKAGGGGTHPSMNPDFVAKQAAKAEGAPVETFTKTDN